ncbi:MAG: homoserine kinase [Gemmatimonadetes bacterium]|nr:homoserine kinase [Gemmatimonadota bacterium]
MPLMEIAACHVPGSIGNFGPGLDILGAAISGGGDSVTATWLEGDGVRVLDPGHPALPTDPTLHASAIAASAVLRLAIAGGLRLPRRAIGLSVRKGLPLAGGQGGSAASAVAGAVATNALLGSPCDRDSLIRAALEAESRVAGAHLDNIAPSLLGGICLVRAVDPVDIVRLPVPTRLRLVIAHPAQELRTADARAVLPAQVDRALLVRQMANVAALVAALYADDLPLLGRALDDQVAEPARSPLIPGFEGAKAAAMAAGALGASISGAGPTMFAACDSDVGAQRVSHAVRAAYESAGIDVNVRVARVDPHGARVDQNPPGAG